MAGGGRRAGAGRVRGARRRQGGEHTVVCDLHETIGQQVVQEAADELVGGNRAAPRATGAEGDAIGAHVEQARFGDGDAVGVASEAAHDLLGCAEGPFGVHEPVAVAQRADEFAQRELAESCIAERVVVRMLACPSRTRTTRRSVPASRPWVARAWRKKVCAVLRSETPLRLSAMRTALRTPPGRTVYPACGLERGKVSRDARRDSSGATSRAARDRRSGRACRC